MYRYDEFDHRLVAERVAQFRGQVARRLSGELSEEEFKPLRLMNGLYLQLHAYMLRVAIPYGTLSARQLRKLARIARVYDRGYGHFTTRQNIQFNWPKLDQVPDLLAELAEVEMHAIQTSGNCIRNVTADPFSGAAGDEIADSRITAEIIRQWSTLHPEFSFLPRKFKIAVAAAKHDRAAVKLHDIGLYLIENETGERGFEVIVGGGQGRTPRIGQVIRRFLPERHLLSYLEAILRVYNRQGRRDNIYKARIKILVAALGPDAFAGLVEAEWRQARTTSVDLPAAERARIAAYFAPPALEPETPLDPAALPEARTDRGFGGWLKTAIVAHRVPGHAIVTLSLKPIGGIPGDVSAEQMDLIADLAERHGQGEIRVTYQQNLVLPHVRVRDLYPLWRALRSAKLATPNIGLVSDIIACPGLDYCTLANARSIPIAQTIGRRFQDLKRQHRIGPLSLNISGCINACAHHHAGNIGILGVAKLGQEFYQITLGGSAGRAAALGDLVGPAFAADRVANAVENIIETYLAERKDGETFLQTYRRVGLAPFKEALYAPA